MKTSRPRPLRFPRPALLLLVFWLAALAGAKTDSPLEMSMQQIKKAYKDLVAGLDKPIETNKATYLSLAGTIKTSAMKARELVPEMAAKLPPDQQAAMVKSFRESMADFLVSVDALIKNIQDAKWDEARKDLSLLKSEMKDGHREFRRED